MDDGLSLPGFKIKNIYTYTLYVSTILLFASLFVSHMGPDVINKVRSTSLSLIIISLLAWEADGQLIRWLSEHQNKYENWRLLVDIIHFALSALFIYTLWS